MTLRPKRWLLVLALGVLLGAAPVSINWEVFDPDWRPSHEAQ